MNIWAIADLHLAFGDPSKSMEVFGPEWIRYAEKIEENWRAVVNEEDLVLIAGDISWAKHVEQAQLDLDWIHRLPGVKVCIKGNHEYWWGSLSKVKKVLPPSIHLIQNDAFHYKNISVGGTRLWDTDAYSFDAVINYQKNPLEKEKEEEAPDQEKIFNRELERLELSLKQLNKESLRIAMTHYPPIGLDLAPSKASALLEKYGVEYCVFGHLHSVKKAIPLFGTSRGVTYRLTSADYLDFKPLKLCSI